MLLIPLKETELGSDFSARRIYKNQMVLHQIVYVMKLVPKLFFFLSIIFIPNENKGKSIG